MTAEDLQRLISRNVRLACDMLGVRQQREVAAQAGMTEQSYSRKLNNERSWRIDDLPGLGRALGIPLNLLLGPSSELAEYLERRPLRLAATGTDTLTAEPRYRPLNLAETRRETRARSAGQGRKQQGHERWLHAVGTAPSTGVSCGEWVNDAAS